MAYDSINDAAKALFNSISTAAKDATFTTASSTEALMEGAALIKAAKVVGELVTALPTEAGVLLNDGAWARPTEWLPMPELVKADNTFAGLFAIFPESGNVVALSAAGAYTVDWGDGVVENFATGATAEHEYNYASISGTPFRGYKQAIIKVYPQAGQTLTLVDLVKKHTKMSTYSGVYSYPYLEIKFYSTTATGFRAEHPSASSTRTSKLGMLEHLEMSFDAMGSIAYLLYANKSLAKVTIKDSAITSLESAFGDSGVQEIDIRNTSCANLQYAFLSCKALVRVSAFDIIGSSIAYGCFSGCTALVSFPDIQLNGVWNCSNMFDSCSALLEAPNMTFTGSINAASMFTNCRSLVKAKLINFAACTTYTSMFANCGSLRYVHPIRFAGGDVSNMFNGCFALVEPPIATVANGVSLYQYLTASGITWFDSDTHLVMEGTTPSLSGIFTSCSRLKSVKFTSLYGATNITNMCSSCLSLVSLELPSINSQSSVSGLVPTSSDLRVVRIPGAKLTINVAHNKLSAAALNQLFTDLASGVSAQTITVTGNMGINEPGYDPTIATAKGWTVTA